MGGSRTVDLGRTIDWREFHHFCLTYDGPSRGGNSDLTFYFDGDKRWTENVLLDTAPEGTAMRLGTDATYDRPLTGALDEAYIYASALDASAVAVLYGSVSAAPTVTPVPTSHLFEGSLVAYYPFVDGTTQDAHHTWNGYPESMTTTEGRDGSTAIVLDADHGDSVWLPWEVVQDLDGDADRTVCLWARIDEWNGGYLFHYGGSSDPGSYAPTLQETYEPTVEETAAPSYLTWVPTTAPPTYKPSSAPTPRPTVPRPTYHPTSAPAPAGDATRRRRRLTHDEQTELYASFGLRVGTAEGDLVIIADDTRASVSLGRTIDWRVFHHFCLTYDGPSRGGESTLAFYFDGDQQLQETLSLDTKIEEGRWMCLGMSQMYSDSLSAALDEVYVYASALDASDIEVLYGSVSAAPTVTPVPTSHLFEGSLVAYYPFVGGTTQDAHHTWDGTPESMTTTEGRDGGTAIVLEHGAAVTLPWEATQDMLGDADRTVCLWARIDEWKGGCLFYYGGDSSHGTSSSAATSASCSPSGATRIRQLQWRHDVGGGRITGVLPGEFVCCATPSNPMARTGPGRTGVAFIEEANCDGTCKGGDDSCARGGEDATGAAMSYSYSYSYGGSSASRRRRSRRILLVLVLSRNCDWRGPHGRVCGADIWPLRRNR